MPLKLIKGSRRDGLTLHAVQIRGIKSEMCTKCGTGFMLHKSVYVYTCSYPKCQFSYQIEPSAPKGKNITILNKPNFLKRRF